MSVSITLLDSNGKPVVDKDGIPVPMTSENMAKVSGVPYVPLMVKRQQEAADWEKKNGVPLQEIPFTVEDTFTKMIPHNLRDPAKIAHFTRPEVNLPGQESKSFIFHIYSTTQTEKWYLNLCDVAGNVVVKRYTDETADVTLQVSMFSWLRLFLKEENPQILGSGEFYKTTSLDKEHQHVTVIMKHLHPEIALLAGKIVVLEGNEGMAMRIRQIVREN